HDIDVVGLDVLFERGCKARAVGFLHRNAVLDRHGVEHLAAEAFGYHTRANALAGGIHGCRGTGRATALDQTVDRFLRAQFLGLATGGRGVELGKDLFHTRAALTEHFTVQEHGRHGHDLAGLDFRLEQCAVDRYVA